MLKQHRTMTRKKKFLYLTLLPAYFLIAGLFLQPLPDIYRGLITILKEPDFLITDYIAIGGIGAAFINAGILTLVCIGILYFLNMEMDGHTITSIFLMMGFSLFGKNILNIWAILFGVWCYARYHKVSVSKYIYVGFYGTCLSPIITQIMQLPEVPPALKLILSLLAGAVIGFVLPPLSTHVFYLHKGYSLYNVGFSSGIIATVIISVFKSFGLETESRLIWSTGNDRIFAVLLFVFFLLMIALGRFHSPTAFSQFRAILKSSGLGGTDYVQEDGFSTALVNMGINGIVATAFVLLVGGDLNGPTIGGIFTVVGFGATGKHVRNILPVMMGVWLASLTKTWNITDPSPIITLLFSTTLAPIAGEFGVIAGIIAGFLHSSVAMNVGIIYGGMNLYNNGFAGGIVAAFMVPIIQSIEDRKARAKGTMPL
ncbi:DUF1576 domain-containing protein [Bariatricus massiliensis]|uniref:DUF1576 domain-containing protein n=1 Tax=Bariatricus massiliensis TaxID=1745713 RepID=A0ABS8DLB4_9FIRM|nr:DUF1576 domain-containing protein [Bariatricus massiliensis]MCB7306100.1 DUF1576 domain-containing protein [Bariatricus massiliensis]MCB7376531.1 DUF1576 domain-containing protein [Bariatricus massiliensis]MCB7389243.1 DUF1576 domain-containing protein [Bariatricus massiliensis]MCB7413416.1 DUF1576 domain-containing protein [Bariatricus massiliensis]MCQ5255256.1 DUF1576 domain-containing protein [Bariatricus massiliensis]